MKITETNLGFLIEDSEFTALFGGQKANLQNLKASFPKIEFIRVKQTHSDIVVHSEDIKLDYQIEADAHFTSEVGLGLCISTADCIPLLIFDRKAKTIAGIHAGWRGIAQEIVPKTVKRLQKEGSQIQDLQILVGPHIQKESFEVGWDVRDQLLKTISETADQSSSYYHQNISEQKALVDLDRVLRRQLEICGATKDNVRSLNIDTFTDLRFHSFRRDKEKSGRQLSFIVKN